MCARQEEKQKRMNPVEDIDVPKGCSILNNRWLQRVAMRGITSPRPVV